MAHPTHIHAQWLEKPSTQALMLAFAQGLTPLRFVGGCVRDALLGQESHDVDAATSASPEQVIALLEAAEIRVIPTGIKHGTVTAMIGERAFEITTLRKDVACDGRHAEVEYTDDWAEDAARRDFTMNALYADADGKLYDPLDTGIDDAVARRVRFIGDAESRIAEDGLRILRYFRFLATHARPPYDPVARAACRAHKAMLRNLSGERIQHEMLKLFAAETPYPALIEMQEAGLLSMLHLPDRLPEAYEKVCQITPIDSLVRLSFLLRHMPDAETALQRLCQQWKLSTNMRRALERLIVPLPALRDMPEKALQKLLRSHGRTALLAQLHIEKALEESPSKANTKRYMAQQHLIEQADIPEFPLSGSDLIAHGMTPGAALGSRLRALESFWEAHDFAPNKDELLSQL